MPRKFFVLGNWKMNVDKASIDSIIDHLKKASLDPATELVIGCPSCYLYYVRHHMPSEIGVAAQNCYKVDIGAFTGETSCTMIKDCGCKWVILGHGERRQIFGETDELISEKIGHALEDGLSVIVWIGDNLEEHEAGKTEEACFKQLAAIKKNVTDWTNVVIAYEALWAASGKTATPQQVQATHAAVRNWLAENVSPEAAEAIRIVYGGHVAGDNCKELASLPDVDGFLVGAAALKPTFVDIINANQ